MAKVRVHELAKEFGLDSKELLHILQGMGEFVKSASSTLEPPVIRKVTQRLTPSLAPASPAQPAEPSVTIPKPSPTLFRRPPLSDRTEQQRSQIAPQQNGPPELPRLHPQSTPSPISVTRRVGVPTKTSTTSDLRVDSARGQGWHAGAVRKPTDPRLLAHIRDLGRQFPKSTIHLEALRRLGSQIVQVGRPQGALRGARVRFSGAIESAFGFTREVLFLYSPYTDLQTKTIEEGKRLLAQQNAFITPDVIFVYAPDSRLSQKLADWSTPSLLLVPLSPEIDDDPQSLIRILRQNVYGRDLFYITTPVDGSRFFGRKVLLQELRDDVRNGRVAGIYGLRKAGKTSVLKELASTSEDDQLSVLVDLESFPCPPEDATDEILLHIARRLASALRERGIAVDELATFRGGMAMSEWKFVVQITLERINRDGLKVLLLLDEIEYLTSDQIDLEEGDMPRISQMLATFRSLAQESGNFTFVLSGLASALTESGRLYGRPNPLFAWAKNYYVSPFTRSEANDLTLTLGGKMGIRFDQGALEALYVGSGGHAFLYRSLASAAVEQLSDDAEERRLGVADIQRAYIPWSRDVAGHVQEILNHIKRYYSVESLLIDSMMTSGKLSLDLARSYPQALNHMLKLGLIVEEENEFHLNSLLELAR